jgi:hypothetical protein
MATHAINPTVVCGYLSGRKYILDERATAAAFDVIAALPNITARATY